MSEDKISDLGNKLFASTEGRNLMIKLKTDIQNTLVYSMNNSQKDNLRNGIRDNKTIEDVLKIAKKELSKLNKNEDNIFAVSKSTSVILKELDYYDYGTLTGLTKIFNILNTDNNMEMSMPTNDHRRNAYDVIDNTSMATLDKLMQEIDANPNEFEPIIRVMRKSGLFMERSIFMVNESYPYMVERCRVKGDNLIQIICEYTGTDEMYVLARLLNKTSWWFRIGQTPEEQIEELQNISL
ncbi:hypothetical protein ACFX5D_16120 [Flavobacterium sp. LB3P45]|uniref:Uncharacterized protein n=1 Tax=Flavobacterium fructosi TaxID=3230416 RepID=A0ABW6HRS3_9FLAO